MAELVDALDSGSSVRKDVRVQISPSAPIFLPNLLATRLSNINLIFFNHLLIMLKHLNKLLAVATLVTFIPLSHAQDSKSEDKELSKEEEAAEKLLTLPSVLAPSAASAIESNSIIQAQSISGIDSATAAALGSAGLSALTSQLSGNAATRATQLKTLVSLVEVFSNAADASLVGRRAIDPTADLTNIINSIATTITTDHLTTLSKLDSSHMTTFASDGVANMDNFAARVDVTSAMLGSSIDTIDTTNLSTVVEHLHASLDGDSLTALKSLEKTHMSTLSTGIDLTSSFDASTLKQSVKKFATKAEVTVEFAKVAAGGADLSGVDLAAVATNIHSNLDDDHLTALQQLDPTHLATMATGTDLTALSAVDVAGKLKHFATKAEVVVEFAKVSAGTATADASGNIDFSTISIGDFVTNIHTNLDEDHTTALANLDPSHMATMAAGTDLTATGVNVATKLTHFATKAEVVVEFAKVSAGVGADLSGVAIGDFVTNVHANLDEDHTTALAKLDPSHMATMAAGTDLTAGLQADDLSHFATKGELASVYVDAGGASVDIASIVTTIHATITVEFTTSLKEFDPSHMTTMVSGGDISAVANIGHKAKVAHAYKDNGGSVDDILTNVANISTADLLHFAELDHTDLKSLAASVDITKVHEDAAHKAKAVAGGYTLDEAIALEGDALAAVGTSTKDELVAAKASGKSLTDHANEAHGASQVQDAATLITNLPGNRHSGFQVALESAVTVANLLLTPRTVTNDEDLADDITLSSLAASGYNTELVRLLAQYGALGENGTTLADAVLGSSYVAFNQSIGLETFAQADTSYYQQFLTDLGARALGKDVTGSTVTSVSTSNIKISTGSNITFTAGATLDASDVLPDGKTRRIAMIGAAKDMTIKGDLTVTNSNKTENGVVVLGAADDLYIRSEESPANSADYIGNPDVVNLTYTGANAAIGAQDTIKLINVSMSTGGNLAIGTLDELHIGTATAQSNSISVGTGGENSDPDNVYMYAQNLIQINGLNINGRVDDVYMEAITLNLRNVNFPTTSEVVLRSQMGSLHFGTFDSPTIGGVNLTNVKHGTDTLSQSSFSGKVGNWATTSTHPNGTPKVKVINF